MYKIILTICFVLVLYVAPLRAQDKVSASKKAYHFVFFPNGKSYISPEEWSKLEAFVWDLNLSKVGIESIEVHGYTHPLSEKKYTKLSADRASIVKEVLFGFGIKPQLMRTSVGVSKVAKIDEDLQRRATVCVTYTGVLTKSKKEEEKPAAATIDPNFDKTIEVEPALPTKKEDAKKKETVEAERVPSAPKKPAKSSPKAEAPKPAEPEKKAGE